MTKVHRECKHGECAKACIVEEPAIHPNCLGIAFLDQLASHALEQQNVQRLLLKEGKGSRSKIFPFILYVVNFGKRSDISAFPYEV